jgi:hypothetical protein
VSEIFTIIDETRPTSVDASIDEGRVLLAHAAIEQALGWELKPEGFCRDAVCVPVRENSGMLRQDRVDLAAFADLLARPLALDVEERAAALAASAEERGSSLATGEAPEFTLPDLSGRMHSLSNYRGKKLFLAVWASW